MGGGRSQGHGLGNDPLVWPLHHRVGEHDAGHWVKLRAECMREGEDITVIR